MSHGDKTLKRQRNALARKALLSHRAGLEAARSQHFCDHEPQVGPNSLAFFCLFPVKAPIQDGGGGRCGAESHNYGV